MPFVQLTHEEYLRVFEESPTIMPSVQLTDKQHIRVLEARLKKTTTNERPATTSKTPANNEPSIQVDSTNQVEVQQALQSSQNSNAIIEKESSKAPRDGPNSSERSQLQQSSNATINEEDLVGSESELEQPVPITESSKIRLYIQSEYHTLLPIVINQNNTVLQLKQAYKATTVIGSPEDVTVRFLYLGKEVKDEQTLMDLGLKNEDTIQAQIWLRDC